MKLLLINPASDDTTHKDLREYLRFYFPSLTLPYVASLTPGDVEVDLLDEEFQYPSEVNPADLVLIIGKTHQAKRMYALANHYRKTGVKVILGGPHVSLMQNEAKEYADSVIVDSIEGVWKQVIEDFKNQALKARYAGATSVLLSDLPFPKIELLKKRKFKNSVNSILTSAPKREPFSYDYDKAVFNNGEAEFRNISTVLEEISSMDQNTIFFRDSNIASNLDHVFRLLNGLKSLHRRYFAKCDLECFYNKDIINEFKASGCEALILNVETFNSSNVDYTKRKNIHSIPETIEIVKRIREKDILVYPEIIVGFDHDNAQTLNDLYDFVKLSGIDKAFIRILTPMPGTKLYESLEVQGRLLTKDWNEYDTTRAIFRTKGIEPATLEFTFESLIRRIVRNRFRKAIIKSNT